MFPTCARGFAFSSKKPRLFLEPFAGGGIVSLTIAFEDRAGALRVVELGHDVASLWKTILSGDNAWLCERITHFNLTADNVRGELAQIPVSDRELAFQTLFAEPHEPRRHTRARQRCPQTRREWEGHPIPLVPEHARECQKIKGDFLMTYDNAPELVALAKANGFNTRTVSMKNTHHAMMTELLIGRDLSWA